MTLADVPFIDVAPLRGDDRDAQLRVAAEIDRACRGSGFFYAVNHGIDLGRLQETVDCFHAAMTDEEKWQLAINAYNPGNPHVRNGYYMAVKGKKAVESFCYLNPAFTADHPMIRVGAPGHEVNLWPDEARHPGFRDYCEGYFTEILQLSKVLLRGFALALGKPAEFFDAAVRQEDSLSAVSLIRYPYLEDYPPVKRAPDGTELSFEDHRDVSLITVLYQTPVPNLQVETAQGWQDVPTSGDAFLINCGSFMPYLTRGYYPAPVHRVAFINAERLSLPLFVHAGHESRLEPFSPHGAPVAQDDSIVTYGDYLQHGLRALIDKNGQT